MCLLAIWTGVFSWPFRRWMEVFLILTGEVGTGVLAQGVRCLRGTASMRGYTSPRTHTQQHMCAHICYCQAPAIIFLQNEKDRKKREQYENRCVLCYRQTKCKGIKIKLWFWTFPYFPLLISSHPPFVLLICLSSSSVIQPTFIQDVQTKHYPLPNPLHLLTNSHIAWSTQWKLKTIAVQCTPETHMIVQIGLHLHMFWLHPRHITVQWVVFEVTPTLLVA